MLRVRAVRRIAGSAALALATASVVPRDAAAQRGGGRGRGGIQVMTLTSAAFADGGAIPGKYAQQGRDVSPPLAWTGAPDSTVSFVLIVHDADAAVGDGTDDMLHWMVWGIPGSASSLPEGVPQGMLLSPSAIGAAAPAEGGRGGRGGRGGGVRQISVSGPYYRGPAAPASGSPHHYVFELYALDANVSVQPSGQSAGPPTRAAVMEAMKGHIRGKATLVGTYRRPAP
ncbi:MAG: YbhB/YbcL family Raf kinase inhibitor-like protein [Gemmatimonadota bacterium]|nr:YbhB/YbcL family Raf kinase inhibitor-like protein [Gemmatimonadota bacterium]